MNCLAPTPQARPAFQASERQRAPLRGAQIVLRSKTRTLVEQEILVDFYECQATERELTAAPILWLAFPRESTPDIVFAWGVEFH